MIQVYLVDRSAEARQALNSKVEKFLTSSEIDLQYVPRLATKLLAPQELKFHPNPDLVIIGPELISQELALLGSLKRTSPHAPFLAMLPEGQDKLATIEQILRVGADDVLPAKIDTSSFFQKVLVHAQKSRQQKAGKLIIVDSGKGGVGVTSIVAGLGEALAQSGKRVCLVDLDFDSQDLSRFLQVRPFINENLELLARGQRSANQEFVLQTVFPVWGSDKNLFCVPPITDSELIYEANSGFSRAFVSVLEILDNSFDVVIVDAGCARASLLQTLYHVADTLFFVLSNDPASFYAASAKLNRYRGLLAQTAPVILVENSLRKDGLPVTFLREELERSVGATGLHWAQALPFCKHAMRWPGSGETLYSSAKMGGLSEKIVNALQVANLLPEDSHKNLLARLKEKFANTSSAEFKRSTLLKLPWFGNKQKPLITDTRAKEALIIQPAEVTTISKEAPTLETAIVKSTDTGKLFGDVKFN